MVSLRAAAEVEVHMQKRSNGVPLTPYKQGNFCVFSITGRSHTRLEERTGSLWIAVDELFVQTMVTGSSSVGESFSWWFSNAMHLSWSNSFSFEQIWQVIFGFPATVIVLTGRQITLHISQAILSQAAHKSFGRWLIQRWLISFGYNQKH